MAEKWVLTFKEDVERVVVTEQVDPELLLVTPAGYPGAPGLPGATGPQGPIGPTGAKGDTGATGATGIQGPKGDTGDTGPQGIQGPAGADGTDGIDGAPGPQGIQGVQGLKGDKGDQGEVGLQGFPGNDGADGATGATGPKGDTGATGAAGPKGDTGATGPAGAPGAQGPKGDKGDTGDTGPQGPQGLGGVGAPGRGITSISVIGGNQAQVNYSDGSTSTFTIPTGKGISSIVNLDADTAQITFTDATTTTIELPAGPQGPAGPTGAQGPKGDTGNTGAQGIQGVKGDTGTAGAAGATGATGPAGPGVPTGGTTGQILAKTSGADYATGWVAAPTGGGGSTSAFTPVDPQIYRDTLDATFNSNATGTWTTVPGLALSFTTVEAGFLTLNSRVRVNQVQSTYVRAVISPNPVAGQAIIGSTAESTQSNRQTHVLAGAVELAATTAYTVTVQVFALNAGWSVDATPEDTELVALYSPKGGPQVGAWENNGQTAFQYPTPMETNRQSNPIAIPSTRQTVPTFEVDVTAPMLITNTGFDVGHVTAFVFMALVRSTGASGTGSSFNTESSVLRAGQGAEVTHGQTSSFAGQGASGARMMVCGITPGVAVGDKARFRVWFDKTDCGIEWWAVRPVLLRVGNKVDSSGRAGLFRDIVPTGAMGGFVPTTTLTNSPTNWVNSSQVSTMRYIDNGIIINAFGGLQDRPYFSNGIHGFAAFSEGFTSTNVMAISSWSTTNAPLMTVDAPTQWRVDRLFVPPPP